ARSIANAREPAMRFIRRYGLFGLAAAAMFLIVVVPLAIVIVQGFVAYEGGTWHLTVAHMRLVLGRSVYWLALLNTLIIGLVGTPVVIGWARQLYFVTSRIYLASQEVPPALGVMAILAVYLILLSLAATMLQRWLLKGRSFVTVSGKGFRTRPIVLGRPRYL